MSNSQVPAAIRAIQAALVAGLPAGTLVIVGPGNTSDTSNVVFVGVGDPDETSYATAATGSQKWAQLGGGRRDETFQVHCSAVAWNGDSDTLAAMDAAYALQAACETAIVADPTLGGALLYAPGIESTQLKFATDANGAAAQVLFDVTCRTRI